jgi:cysteine-rich repeat protein
MCRNRRFAAVSGVLLVVMVLSKPLAAEVVVSQIYGGGGNAGALLKLDFVELFNRGAAAVPLDGWSLQYASATAATWQGTALAGALQPGAYYLVQLGGGTGGSVDLPPPDAIGTTNMSAAAGKVALVAGTTLLSAACPNDAGVQDFVGYGGANCFEGAGAAPAGSNTAALLRRDAGCADTDDSAADFETASPLPRNQSSPLHPCLTGPASATPADTPTHTATSSPSVSPTASPEDTVTPTLGASPSPSHTASASATASPTASATAGASETPTATESATTSSTSTPHDTETPTTTPSATSTAIPDTPTPTATARSTADNTETATVAVTPSESPAATRSATSTPDVPPTATASPQPTEASCGNAVVEPGEQCDDGNQDDFDLCPNGCAYGASGRLIHGNHRLRLVRGDGCQLEWYVADRNLARDPHGFVSPTQSCADQDEGCDFAAAAGRCRFMIVACLNNADPNLPACRNRDIRRAEIVHPPNLRGGLRTSTRVDLEHALGHLVDPDHPERGAVGALPLSAEQRNFCSRPFPVDVDVRGRGVGVVSLIVDTFSAAELAPRRERARLRLICTP